MADLPVVFSFMVRCGLEAHVRYKKELNKLLSSFDFRCGLCLSADMSGQPVAVLEKRLLGPNAEIGQRVVFLRELNGDRLYLSVNFGVIFVFLIADYIYVKFYE